MPSFHNVKMSSYRGKYSTKNNPKTPPFSLLKIDEMPLIDLDAKIVETQCEFDLYELKIWAFRRLHDHSDAFSLRE